MNPSVKSLHDEAVEAYRASREKTEERNAEVLRIVSSGEVTITSLAAALGVTPSRVSHMIASARRLQGS